MLIPASRSPGMFRDCVLGKTPRPYHNGIFPSVKGAANLDVGRIFDAQHSYDIGLEESWALQAVFSGSEPPRLRCIETFPRGHGVFLKLVFGAGRRGK